MFISHSWEDKPFVRRLARKLWEEEFQVWLDEKELVPGDALASRLSDALAQSRVIIVVVTPASVKSKWLAFELNQAAELMVADGRRIIPALKGDVEVPAELKGIVYADFRTSFKQGFGAICAALEHETDAAVKGSWAELRSLVGEVFDSEGLASAMAEYDSFDYYFVQVPGIQDSTQGLPGEDADVIYDLVHDHLGDKEPLSEEWWSEYLDVQDRYPGVFRLIVTERPVKLSKVEPSSRSSRIWRFIRHEFSLRAVVLVDVSNTEDLGERRDLIRDAQDELKAVAAELRMWKGPAPQ